MQTTKNIPLASLTTMRLGGPAQEVVTVTTKDELIEATQSGLPLLVLGQGSNMVVRDQGFAGRVILNRILGFDILNEDAQATTVKIGAGEVWDKVVEKTAAMGLSGIEALSAIPGTAGATPVQNVGAYGQEIAQTLIELEAYNLQQKQFVTLSNTDCQFSYRDSRFKNMENRHFIITSITLRLSKQPPQPPFYASVQAYFDQHNITDYTAQTVRNAVIAIRAVKLPDPKKIANSGSFFKNPIISNKQFTQLQAKVPQVPHWPMADGTVKVAAGWLIEQAGLKGFETQGMQVYPQNALVLVNKTATTYADLEKIKQHVQQRVQHLFGILLEQEPELL